MSASYHIFENFTVGLAHLSASFSSPAGWVAYGAIVGDVYRITIPAGISVTSGQFHMLSGRANLTTGGSRTYSGELRWRRTAGTQEYRIGFVNPSGGAFNGATGVQSFDSLSTSEWTTIAFSGGTPNFAFQDRISLISRFTATSTESVFEIDYAKLWIGTEATPAPSGIPSGIPIGRLISGGV